MHSSVLSRRQAILSGLSAAVAVGVAANPAAALDTRALGEPLGVAGLAIRKFLVADFSGTLRVLRAMGYGQIELSSFAGSIGDYRGDYAGLEGMTPAGIRKVVADAGMISPSWRFYAPEFAAGRWVRTLDWARGVGARQVVYNDFTLSARPTLDDVKRQAAILNEAGERVRAGGMQMSIHTSASLFKTLGDGSVADALLREVDAAHCQLQLDFGSVVQAGADGPTLIRRHSGRINSLHLRDGKKPSNPDDYFPALALGEGEVDWGKVIAAARAAGIRQYIVEMQLRPAFGMLDTLKTSIDYLRALKV